MYVNWRHTKMSLPGRIETQLWRVNTITPWLPLPSHTCQSTSAGIMSSALAKTINFVAGIKQRSLKALDYSTSQQSFSKRNKYLFKYLYKYFVFVSQMVCSSHSVSIECILSVESDHLSAKVVSVKV